MTERDEIDKAWNACEAGRWERAESYTEFVIIAVVVIAAFLVMWMT